MVRVVPFMILLLTVGVLSSCMESEQTKLNRLAELQKQNLEMKAEIQKMEQEAAKVVVLNDFDQKLLNLEHDIVIQKSRERDLDAFIDALTLRRDALRAKIDGFKQTHPID